MTADDPDLPLLVPVLGRLVRPADYVRALATPSRLRSPHFAVHHLEGRPLPLKSPAERQPSNLGQPGSDVGNGSTGSSIDAPLYATLSTELSTGTVLISDPSVDDLHCRGAQESLDAPFSVPLLDGVAPVALHRWLGLVVPKRHAKRAVTRTLLKRQIRDVVRACAAQLAPGLWVVRQRSPFDVAQYPSAASQALKEAVRAELGALFERAVRGERDRVKPRDAGAGTGTGTRSSRRSRSGKRPVEPAGPSAARLPLPVAAALAAPAEAPDTLAPPHEGFSCAA